MIWNELLLRLKDAGLVVEEDCKPPGYETMVSGSHGLYKLRITLEPDIGPERLIRIVMEVERPAIQDIELSRPVLLDWVNTKNSDINFGRYYLLPGEEKFVFETAIPVVEGTVCWAQFQELLRVSLFSVDDGMAQLYAIAEHIKGR